MYLVRLEDNSKHSIWYTMREAIRQSQVLENNGYKKVDIEKIESNEYANGQYFC